MHDTNQSKAHKVAPAARIKTVLLPDDIHNLLATDTGDGQLTGRTAASQVGTTAYYGGTAGNDTLTGGIGDDVLDGLEGNDSLSGSGGNDALLGGAGHDTLNGGGGIDTMLGGAGNDTYHVDSTYDQVFEHAEEGLDQVISNVNYTLQANVEHLTLTGRAKNGTGNILDNSITGNAYDNRLDGGAGNDTLSGGAGHDTYYVDSADDRIVEYADEGWDLVVASVDYRILPGVEDLQLTGTAVTGWGNSDDNWIIGNSVNNTILGFSGNDWLQGGGGDDDLQGEDGDDELDGGIGNDTMWGGAGNDTLVGRSGDDTYYITDSDDRVVEDAGDGWDQVFATVSHTLAANIEELILSPTLVNIDGTGNDLNNRIVGNDKNNVLDGGLGNDTLIGGIGIDVYYVDSAGDQVVEDEWGSLEDKVYAICSYTLADYVEFLILTGSAATGIGNDLDNIIDGNDLNNSLAGGAGNDLISGLGGDDIINGDSGDDDLIGSLGNDTLIGGAGSDRLFGGEGDNLMIGGLGNDLYWVGSAGDQLIEYAGEGRDEVFSGFNFTLGSNLENLYLDGTAVYGIGNDLNNIIQGSEQDNVLDGGVGNDSLYGGLGNDSLYGAWGDDLFNGGDGRDLLNGNEGRDTLVGGEGDDTLDGGVNGDLMVGGVGNDAYFVNDENDKVVENVGEGRDTLFSELDVHHLHDGIENLSLLGARIGIGNDLDNDIRTITNHRESLLAGEGGNDTLLGGGGADTLRGGDGFDNLYGREGADRFEFDHADTGFDTIIDFVAGVDKIVLTGFHFTALIDGENFVLGTGPIINRETIFYNISTGALFYDIDGTGSEAATQIAKLENRASLTVSDFIVI